MSGGHIGVGIDSFSYHRYFGEVTPWEQPSGVRWTTADFLRRARALGVGTVSLQTVYLPELTSPVLESLRQELQSLGLQPVLAWGHPDGLQGGENPDRVAALRGVMRAASRIGCTLVRLVCGNQFSRSAPVKLRINRLAPILKDLAEEASGLGLTLAVENHADFTMRELVGLVGAVANDRLGICFDTGNAVRVGDDLLEATTLAGPFVKMVHLKDMIVIAESRGDPTAWWPAAPLGRGHFDIPAFIDVLRAADFAGTLFVEMANMHPDWPDEDRAVAESIVRLRELLAIG